MDEPKIKELIRLLIAHYYNVRGGENTTTSKTELMKFNENNPQLVKTYNALWQLINNTYADGTPSDPDIVQYFYDEYQKKKGGRKLRSTRNRKRSQRRVRRRVRSSHISRTTMKGYDKN